MVRVTIRHHDASFDYAPLVYDTMAAALATLLRASKQLTRYRSITIEELPPTGAQFKEGIDKAPEPGIDMTSS